MRQLYVYIMSGRWGVLYVGVTRNLTRRVHQHRESAVPGFTAKYRATRLVYFEVCGEAVAAIAREKEIKRWRRQKKLALIRSTNPGWKDLAATWFDHRDRRPSSSPVEQPTSQQDSSLRSE
jgi:putative endonuclease